MKSVIIGGGGFLGSHLSGALISEDHIVSVFDRPEARYLEFEREQGIKIITGNFLNPEDISRAIAGCDVVYHLVSATVPKTSNDDPCYDVQANVIGTIQLLNEMRKAGTPKIVFASSGGTVYGDPQEISINENHQTNPTSSYGISKLAIEKYLYLYWKLYGIDYRIARISNAFGERQPINGTQGVISAFLDMLLHQREITIWGDGSIIRDYIHASDIANAFLQLTAYEGEPKIFNIGSGQGHSINDIVSILEEITHQPLQPRYLPGRAFDVPVNVLDISRAKFYLHWQPVISLKEGISRAYEWMMREEYVPQ